MKLSATLRVVLLVLISFALYYVLFQNFQDIKSKLDTVTHQGLISYILIYFIIGVPIFIGTCVINNNINYLKYLGLSGNVLTGLGLAALFTIPMFVGGLFFYKFNKIIDFQTLIAGTLLAGFFEELYFRGFLFGQLFKKTSLGFIPAIFFGALVFASGHLYQSQNISELIGIFIVTFSGAIFFAWLYVEWNYNLWVPVFTHTFMNLSWNLFAVDSSALGSVTANVFRGLTIVLAIVFTIKYKRRHHHKLLVNRGTLFSKKEGGI